MRVLVNALSLGSLSGQHVLFGHLAQLARWTMDKHEYLVLHQAAHGLAVRNALPFANVKFIQAPRNASRWATRSVWESLTIPSLLKKNAADRYFTPAGTILPRCPVPQISLAQNPWCLVPQIHKGSTERLKAMLQRAAYKRAATAADLMVYNSKHIQNLYLQNAGRTTLAPSMIAYQGINDETHIAAAAMRSENRRKPFRILSVSAMAPWKGAETVVRATGLLRKKGIPAELYLVGPWPDSQYESRIRTLIQEDGLQTYVHITGKVSVAELHEHYASAQVFCLMSQCESFGIPAVEAQAFGTPVVGSDSCAMAEIGGAGGLFGPPGNAANTARLLEVLLTDAFRWKQYSDAAIRNSERYIWSTCSRPLLKIVDEYVDDAHCFEQPELSSQYETRSHC
jgi:glycosyltransferase involved in cell wall biosynthesis